MKRPTLTLTVITFLLTGTSAHAEPRFSIPKIQAGRPAQPCQVWWTDGKCSIYVSDFDYAESEQVNRAFKVLEKKIAELEARIAKLSARANP